MRRTRRSDAPKKYRYTLELTDDHTQEVMAACDVIGQPTFSLLKITDHEQRVWQMKPNRKVMPSRWIVTDPRDTIAMQFDQKRLGKLVNPLYRVALALLDGQGEEVYRLVDPRTSLPDRILGLGPGEWALLAGDQPVGKLKRFLVGSDRAIVSAGEDHLLPAPVALGMLVIFEALTDASAG